MKQKKELIRQPNSFTYSNQQFTTIEKRIIYNVLCRMDSGINVQPELFSKNMKFSFNWKDLQSDYNDVRAALIKLQSRKLIFNDDYKNQELDSLAPFYRVKMLNGIVSIGVVDEAVPFFLELKQGFTQFQLKAALSLESKYSQRLYELLCSKIWREGGKPNTVNHWRGVDISELRTMLGIEPNKLKQKSEFEDRVLKIAQNEIRQKADIDFEYKFDEDTKQGKQYTSITFTVYPRQNGAEWHELRMEIKDEVNTADNNSKFNAAVTLITTEYQFTAVERDEILTNNKAIDKFLETAININNNVYGDIRNKTAYMRTALKEFLNK